MTRPRHPSYDAPTPGPSLIYRIVLADPQYDTPSPGLSLLGPGRDYADRDAFVEAMRSTLTTLSNAGMRGRLQVSKVYETISEALADPLVAGDEVSMDRTAREILRAERGLAEWVEANAAWEAAVKADGREVCDRCGGAGGYAGWPGYTCYDCGGRGSTERMGR